MNVLLIRSGFSLTNCCSRKFLWHRIYKEGRLELGMIARIKIRRKFFGCKFVWR